MGTKKALLCDLLCCVIVSSVVLCFKLLTDFEITWVHVAFPFICMAVVNVLDFVLDQSIKIYKQLRG